MCECGVWVWFRHLFKLKCTDQILSLQVGSLCVLSDLSTGWGMTPWGCLLPSLQRTAGDCAQGWKLKMDWCHSQWWCCREESRNRDTARTQMSFLDRYVVCIWIWDHWKTEPMVEARCCIYSSISLWSLSQQLVGVPMTCPVLVFSQLLFYESHKHQKASRCHKNLILSVLVP